MTINKRIYSQEKGPVVVKNNKQLFRLTVLCLCALLAYYFSTIRGEIKDGNYWYKISHNDVIYAYLNCTITCGENREVTFKVKKHAKYRINNALYKVDRDGIFICDKNLSPLAFSQEYRSITRHRWVEGVVADKEMKIKVKHKDGFAIERQIPFEEVYYDIALPDIIARRCDEKNFNIKLFDTENLQLVDAHIDIVIRTLNHVQAVVTSDVKAIYDINLKEREISVFVEDANIRIDPTDEKVIKRVNCLEYKEAIKSNICQIDTGKLTSALIRVEWNSTPLGKFQLEDNRQEIEQAYIEGERNFVDLRFKQSLGLNKMSRQLPIDIKEAMLSDTLFIKPNDEIIRKVVSGIKEQHKNEIAIVKGIMAWIGANIEYKKCPETLNATEVMRYKAGKCVEHAILFASMARCAGVPTKIIIGELYKSDHWSLHIWNEVWLGTWVALDPTHASAVSGMSHIKLGEGAGLAEIWPLRMSIVNNINISILDYSTKNISDEIIRGNLYDTYCNYTSQWKIITPNKSWTLHKKLNKDTVTVTMANENNAQITLRFFDIPCEMSSKMLLDSQIKSFLGRFKDAQVTEVNIATLSGQKAPKVVLECQVNDMDYIYEYYVITDSLEVFLFEIKSQKKHFQRLRKCFEQILGSFEILCLPTNAAIAK